MKEITIFTDGASSGNPGPGGFAAVIVERNDDGGEVIEIGGREENTTNNRMELRAVIEALKVIPGKSGEASTVTIYTDSSYVKRGATEWLSKWEEGGWKTKAKKDVLNKDLWQELSATLEALRGGGEEIIWKLLGGHIGISGNERADEIATGFSLGKSFNLFRGSIEKYKKEVLGGKEILNIDHNVELKEKKSGGKSRSRTKAYSYVSMVKGIIQTHKTWEECERRVKGVAAKFKKAANPEEEKKIISEFKKFL